MFKYIPNHACKQQEHDDVHQKCINIYIYNMKE